MQSDRASRPEDYFNDWSFSISKILRGAIEKFYSKKAEQGYDFQYLPLLVPLVTFPSTEVLVAAARNIPRNRIDGKKAPELKRLLYGTTKLDAIKDEEFKEKALDCITSESINNIFKTVPESRIFIQQLSFGRG